MYIYVHVFMHILMLLCDNSYVLHWLPAGAHAERLRRRAEHRAERAVQGAGADAAAGEPAGPAGHPRALPGGQDLAR